MAWRGVVCSVYGHLGETLVAFTTFVALGMDVCGVTAFVAFMGRWRCTFGTWVLFGLCMFLHVQHGWVSPGLAHWGLIFSQPLAPSLRAWRTARKPLRLGVGAHGWRAWVCQP